ADGFISTQSRSKRSRALGNPRRRTRTAHQSPGRTIGRRQPSGFAERRLMRIIAGQFKSRHLKATPPSGTRPTSDKLRETLFNILGESVRGCTFMDGCAGVGAIGIEAISRGAEMVVFIDQARKATRMIRENLSALQIAAGFKILEMDLVKGLDLCVRENV